MGKKNVTRKFFRKISFAKNLLREKKLEYSQPRKFLAWRRGIFARKFLDHYIIELKSAQDEAYLPSTG